MATINFRIEAPITKYETRLSVVENRLVSLIKDFIRDAGQIQGLSVGMSHVEFANGAYLPMCRLRTSGMNLRGD